MPEINKTFYRDLYFNRSAIDVEKRTVELSFSSEQPVTRSNWWGDTWTEVLGHEPGNVDLTRLSQMGVLLFNHNPNMPIGQVVDPAQANEHKCRAMVTFDNDPESEKIYQKVLSGTLKGVSVGYRVQVWEEVNPGEKSTCGRFTGPASIARKWEPFEISVVSIPADSTVGIGRDMNNEQVKDVLRKIVEEVVNERVARLHPQGETKNTGEGGDGGEAPNLDNYRRKLLLLEKSL